MSGYKDSWDANTFLPNSAAIIKDNFAHYGGRIWKKNTVFTVGMIVVPTAAPGAFNYECTTPGTTHATNEPVWPTTAGATVVDGTVIWTARAAGGGGSVALTGQISVKDYGATGDGTTNDRAAIQSAFNALANNGTLVIPEGNYRVINALPDAGTVVQQRAANVANGTLTHITCGLSNITVIFKGVVKGTSILNDVIKFTGNNVTVLGWGGGVQGPGGADAVGFLDTNSDDPTLQWYPSLIRATGKDFRCENLILTDPPAVGIELEGTSPTVISPLVIGGRVTHGETVLFGVRCASTATNAVIIGMETRSNALGGKVYSGVFNSVAPGMIAYGNKWLAQHEHGIYSYGEKSLIFGNSIDNTAAIGTAIQSFADNVLVLDNMIANAFNGGIGIQNGSNTRVAGNIITNAGLGGVIVRTFVSADAGYICNNLDISDNTILFNKTYGGRQGGVDIRVTRLLMNLKVRNNTIDGAGATLSSNVFAGINVEATDYPTHSIRYPLIADNFIANGDGFAMYLAGILYGKVRDNTTKDNATGNITGEKSCIKTTNVLATIIDNNYLIDTRGAGKIHDYGIADGTGSSSLVRNNIVLGHTQATPWTGQGGSQFINNLNTI